MRIERIGNATLVLGDFRKSNAILNDAQCMLTDPPFGIGYSSGYRTDALWSESKIRSDETTMARDEAISMLRGRPMLVFGSWRAPRPAGTRSILIWDKGPALGMGALDIPWKPSFEEIYVIGKGFMGARDQGAVIYCPPVQSTAKNGRVHPNQKPIDLLGRLLTKMPMGCVADPFMGSGSTGVAATKLGRPFVGCETDERYFEIACQRIQDAQRQPDLFVTAAKPQMSNGLFEEVST